MKIETPASPRSQSPGSAGLQEFLQRQQPFVALAAPVVAALATAAQVEKYQPGEVILDAFNTINSELFVVLKGSVDIWNERYRLRDAPDETLGAGDVFGFGSMLTERSVGPRVVAAVPSEIAIIPGSVVGPAFATPAGARFLASHVALAMDRGSIRSSYTLVDDLIETKPLVVPPDLAGYEVARRMSEHDLSCAVLRRPGGDYAIVTDKLLREQLIVARRPSSTPIGELVTAPAGVVRTGDSATEALILMLETDQEFLVVTDLANHLRGVVAPLDFSVSPSTVGVSLHEQIRRAGDIDELVQRSRRTVEALGHLLAGGMSSDRVIAVYSTLLDTMIRRAIELVFAQHPELSQDAFTWLSLGSNGRREAVPSSDADTAVAFIDDLDPAEFPAYRAAFAEVHGVLSSAGLSSDTHGAVASGRLFSRTNARWQEVAREWMAAPEKNKGAIMTSLLVDGRPIWGDRGLPRVARVFSNLRASPGTMRLLLQESLARQAKRRKKRLGPLTRREGTFDIKTSAILPIVNLARWAALSVGSAELPTVDRLRAAAGSEMLPESRAKILIEAFQVLQGLRLQYQLFELRHGRPATDRLVIGELSPIDRSMIDQAVREVAAAQRRMGNVAQFVPIELWTEPEDR